jgi:hypothetical protein
VKKHLFQKPVSGDTGSNVVAFGCSAKAIKGDEPLTKKVGAFHHQLMEFMALSMETKRVSVFLAIPDHRRLLRAPAGVCR